MNTTKDSKCVEVTYVTNNKTGELVNVRVESEFNFDGSFEGMLEYLVEVIGTPEKSVYIIGNNVVFIRTTEFPNKVVGFTRKEMGQFVKQGKVLLQAFDKKEVEEFFDYMQVKEERNFIN